VPVARLTGLEVGERRATRRDRLARAGAVKAGKGRVRRPFRCRRPATRWAATCWPPFWPNEARGLMFWDTSAIIPVLLPEARSATLTERLAADREVTLWWARRSSASRPSTAGTANARCLPRSSLRR